MSELKMIQRVAKEFSSPDELKEYLHDHPNADRGKHWVSKNEKGEEGQAYKHLKVKPDLAKRLVEHLPDHMKVIKKELQSGKPLLDARVHKIVDHLKSMATSPDTKKEDAAKYRELHKELSKHMKEDSHHEVK